MNFLRIIIFSCVALGLTACGAKNSGDVKQAAENIKAANGSPAVDHAQYASACTPPKIPALGTLVFLSSKTVYELSPLDFKKTIVYYSVPGCTSGSESLFVVESGKVKVVNSPQPGEATQEDFAFDTTSAKPVGEATTKILNTEHFCGFTNGEWAVGKELNISTQASQDTCFGKASPRTAQDLVLIQNNTLFLGADTDKSERPNAVDTSIPYTKQN